MLVDSHCHLDRLDLAPFDGDLGAALDAAAASGVERFLCVSIDLASWHAMVRRVGPDPRVAFSVGVHPTETDGPEPTVEQLTALAAHPRVVAIGETGLDYHYGGDRREQQQVRLRTHIDAARATGKPLIIHTRDARADTLRILDEGGASAVGGVLHCFTEDWDMARRAMDLGFYISFSGILTFRSARRLQEVARRMPADRMLVETDAPYLAPVPHRGKPNQPAWVFHVASALAALRGEPLEEVARVTTGNYHRLFGHGYAA